MMSPVARSGALQVRKSVEEREREREAGRGCDLSCLSLSHYICWQRIMRFDTKAKEGKEGREEVFKTAAAASAARTTPRRELQSD